MSVHIDFDRIAAFLQTLETKETEARREAFMTEVTDSGGSYITPHPERIECTHLFEVQMHGVSAWGFGEDEAIRNWRMAASRCMAALIEDDGFITVYPPFPNPRNHGEEIANVRAEMGAF